MKKRITTSLLILSIFAGTLGNFGIAANAKAATTCTAYLSKPCVTTASQCGNTVNLCFNKVAGATQYKVYCANSKDGTYKCIGTTNCNVFKGKTNGNQTCYYKVKACTNINSAKVLSACSNIISTCPTK